MNENVKKALGIVGAAVIGVGIGIAGVYTIDNPEPVIVEKEVVKTVTEFVDVAGETVYVDVPVEVEVVVEDKALAEALCHRLTFDDIVECEEEVSAEDAALNMALNLIGDEKELFDFLEDEGMINDENEARVVKVYSDFEDIVIKKSNFDNEYYKFDIIVRVDDEDKDVKSKVILTIEVEENEASFKSVVKK